MLEWNVYVSDFNDKRIKTHNIFNNARFLDDCKKYARKYPDDKGTFAEAVRHSLMYYYWCKCEWEIILTHWPPREDALDMRIDVYDQVRLNWDAFLDYLWENRKVLTRKKKDG